MLINKILSSFFEILNTHIHLHTIQCHRLPGLSFNDVRFMTPLPADELSKGEEPTMKDWLENYRPARQRTVRSETTKDKAGTLPPALCCFRCVRVEFRKRCHSSTANPRVSCRFQPGVGVRRRFG